MKQITIRDIAKLAGVSTAAVSFALNNKPGISDSKRERILDIAKENGYNNRLNSSDITKGVNIALVLNNYIPTLDRLFYSELNNLVLQEFEKTSYNFICASTYYKDNKLVFSDILRSPDLDAIIMYGDISRELLPEIRSLNIPILVLDCSRKEANQIAVYVDYAEAAYTATKHLIELGHKDIAYIGNDKLNDFDNLTFSGFQRATSENGIVLSMNRIQINVYDEKSLYTCINHALEGESLPTALFCTTDHYAIHAIRYLHTKGLHIPKDISIVSIDDIEISKYMIPSLSTVRIDRKAMASYSFQLLKKMINGEPCSSITLPRSDLAIRESTAPPRNKL